MKIKRLVCCMFVLILLLNLIVPTAFAEESSGDENPVYMENAAAELREGLKNREEIITVTFRMDADEFDGQESSAEQLAREIQKLGLSHTGIPDEGDYLRFSLWYIDPSDVRFQKEDGKWNFTIEYYAVYYTTAEQEAELDGEIQRLVQELNLKGDLTDYQKISAIYNYICGTVVYDNENLEDDSYGLKWSAYAAALNKTAVCQGYATLFYRLALEAGVDNRVITGYAGEDHAWNIVRLDGEYYLLDATWDAGVYHYQWFLKSSADFPEHEPDPEYETDEFAQAYPQGGNSYAHPDMTAVEGDYEYQVTGGKAVILRYNGTEQDVVVPANIGGYPVCWIAGNAFSFNDSIASLTFSEGIRMMESCAIMECVSLRSVHLPSTMDFTASKDPDFQCRVICGPLNCPNVETITVAEGNPNLVVVDNVLYSKDMQFLRYYPTADPREVFEIPEGVISIGTAAFQGNKNLKEVIMPDTVRRLQMDCFNRCSALEKVHISNNCRHIDQYVFSETALRSIHIPASVEMLYYGSFGFSDLLTTITVDPANPVYYAVDNVLYGHLTQEYIQEHYEENDPHMPGEWLVRYPAGDDATSFAVPEGVVGLEMNAFACSGNLTEILLPEGLQYIGGDAFNDCARLAKLKLPDSVTTIESGAFSECTGLLGLVVPAGVKHLGHYVIVNDYLENVVFLGDAPQMTDQTFANETIKIYYPAGNSTWDSVIQMYAHESGVQWIECCEAHQFEDRTRAATCILTGYTGRQCSVCGLMEFDGPVIPPTGHQMKLVREGQPFCESYTSSTYRCAVCGESEEMLIEPIGHQYVDGVCVRCVDRDQAQNETDMALILMMTIGLGLIVVTVVVMLIVLHKK